MQESKSGFRGPVITIAEGHYTATVSPVGAVLESLWFKGRELIMRNPDNDLMQSYSGAICAPWPHGIEGGTYSFEGQSYQLPLLNGEAMHGLCCFQEFEVLEQQKNSVKLRLSLWPQQGYRFAVDITVTYSLSPDAGLRTTVTAENCGANTAPYGVCGHPYVIAGPEPLEEWTVKVPHTVVQSDLERAPSKFELVQQSKLDLREGQVIGDRVLSHSFGGLRLNSEGRWAVTVTAPGGTGVEVSSGFCCPWVTLETREEPKRPTEHRKGLAIQASTAAPHGFKTGLNVVRLKPGESHTAFWEIRGLLPSVEEE